jgi:hypothetical protein
VCFECWCAVAGMRTVTDMARKKASTETALVAYKRGDKVYTKQGNTARDRVSKKLSDAISFLTHHVSAAAGNVQHLVANNVMIT